ncbi:NUDIX hydrolase [Gallaecimonas sp. GXIMD4217]|uniref:NUDIX hydrolase n=1 Tax=Gallaecimonas sp. GXIMD4217 TaxID=3131927 RepID=UPI00311B3184
MIWAPTLAWVVKAGDRYLFVEEDIDGLATLNQPAGHLEPGESLIAGAKRELLEETGLSLDPQGLVGIYRYALPHKCFLRHTFFAELPKVVEVNPQDGDILACHWLTLDQLASWPLRSPLVRTCIEDFEQGHRYPLSVLRQP